jgi:hypothetical protein
VACSLHMAAPGFHPTALRPCARNVPFPNTSCQSLEADSQWTNLGHFAYPWTFAVAIPRGMLANRA